MFYCSQFMRDNIYFIEQYKAIVFAKYNEDKMVCFDIFCPDKCKIDDILYIIAEPQTKTVYLGFTPEQNIGFEITKLQEDNTTLLIMKGKKNLFKENRLMFPLLSHA